MAGNGSSIVVLTTFELPSLPRLRHGHYQLIFSKNGSGVSQKQAQNVVERAIEKLKPRLSKTISLDARILPGPPQSVILDEAEEWRADLIVVGSHGYHAWKRFLLGSVSHQWFRTRNVGGSCSLQVCC